MTRKYTIEEIYNYCKDNKYDLPVINQEYHGNRIPIEFICPKHGEYSQRWSSHKNGSTGCKICRYNKTSKSNRLSWISLVETCKTKGYDIPLNKSEYKNQNSLMTFKCDKHGIYKQRLDSHMQGKTGCKRCEFVKRQRAHQEWDISKIKEYCISHKLDIPQNNQQYKNDDTKYIFICSKHGEYYQSWDKHKLGQLGCTKCQLNNTLLNTNKLNSHCTQQGIDKATDTFKDGNRFYGTFLCKIHNIKYNQRIDMHLGKYKQGCPVCKESHGERFIRNYLDKNNIKYEPQKKFHGLKDKKPLSYDFYLPDNNILIEYQGSQHYEKSDYFGGKEQFKKQQLHDKMKKDYAKNNGYKLLELHYSLDTQEKVSNYLDRNILKIRY